MDNELQLALVLRYCVQLFPSRDLLSLSVICKGLGPVASESLHIALLEALFIAPQNDLPQPCFPHIPQGYIKIQTRRSIHVSRWELCRCAAASFAYFGKFVTGSFIHARHTGWFIISCDQKSEVSEGFLGRLCENMNVAIDPRIHVRYDKLYESDLCSIGRLPRRNSRQAKLLDDLIEYFHIPQLIVAGVIDEKYVLFVQSSQHDVIKSVIRALNDHVVHLHLTNLNDTSVHQFIPHIGYISISIYVRYGDAITKYMTVPFAGPPCMQKKDGPIFFEYPPLEPYPHIID
jgi:hypothetical protein